MTGAVIQKPPPPPLARPDGDAPLRESREGVAVGRVAGSEPGLARSGRRRRTPSRACDRRSSTDAARERAAIDVEAVGMLDDAGAERAQARGHGGETVALLHAQLARASRTRVRPLAAAAATKSTGSSSIARGTIAGCDHRSRAGGADSTRRSPSGSPFSSRRLRSSMRAPIARRRSSEPRARGIQCPRRAARARYPGSA